jgi:hypothetical protein
VPDQCCLLVTVLGCSRKCEPQLHPCRQEALSQLLFSGIKLFVRDNVFRITFSEMLLSSCFSSAQFRIANKTKISDNKILTCPEDRRMENQHFLWHCGNSTHTLLQLCIMLHLSAICMFRGSVQGYTNSNNTLLQDLQISKQNYTYKYLYY